VKFTALHFISFISILMLTFLRFRANVFNPISSLPYLHTEGVWNLVRGYENFGLSEINWLHKRR